MAVINVTLYRQFDKRNNSTAHPADPPPGLTARPYECVGELVNGCDILNPVIAFKFNPEDMAIPEAPDSATIRVVQFNYAYIKDFRRCYFVKNWRHEYGMWVAEMKVDVLASHKASLLMEGNDFYVLRSASDKDESIIDMFYPIVADLEIESKPASLSGMGFWNTGGNINNGYYVAGIINGDTNSYGSVSYYVFTPSQFRNLMKNLFGKFSWLNISEITEELAQALFNPMQYIVSCMWFPTMPECVSVSSIKYGWWNLPISAYLLTKATFIDESAAYFKVEKHPDSANGNGYLNCAPFRTVTGFFEPWGVFDITVPHDADYVYLSISTDFITGTGILKIWHNATKSGNVVEDILAYKQAQVSVPIQISQMSATYEKAEGSSVVASMKLANTIKTEGLWNTIKNTWNSRAQNVGIGLDNSMLPELSSSGTNGSFLSFNMPPKIVTRFRKQASTNNELFGSPLCKNRKISDLKGFVQCANPSSQLMGATETERAEFNRMLESGIYYE